MILIIYINSSSDVLNGIISLGQSKYPSDSLSRTNPVYDWIKNPGISIEMDRPSSNKASTSSTSFSTQHSTDSEHGSVHDSSSQIDVPPLPFYTNELGVLPLFSSGLYTLPTYPSNIVDTSSTSDVSSLADCSSVDPFTRLLEPGDEISDIYSGDASDPSQSGKPKRIVFPVNYFDSHIVLQLYTLTNLFGERVMVIKRMKRQSVYYILPISDRPILRIMAFCSDKPGEWDLFMRTVDELFQSASADFGMYMDEV